jgi:hypothetical protein
LRIREPLFCALDRFNHQHNLQLRPGHRRTSPLRTLERQTKGRGSTYLSSISCDKDVVFRGQGQLMHIRVARAWRVRIPSQKKPRASRSLNLAERSRFLIFCPGTAFGLRPTVCPVRDFPLALNDGWADG